jgi:hypothetical protein
MDRIGTAKERISRRLPAALGKIDVVLGLGSPPIRTFMVKVSVQGLGFCGS